MNSSNEPVNHFDAYAPAEIARMIGEVGVRKARLSALQTTTLGLHAGAFIAFGGMFYTLVVADSALGLGPTRLLGGVAFSLGLILVIIAGAELFSQTDLNKIISALNVLQEQAEAGTTAEDIKEEISRKYPFLEYLKPFIPKTPADVVAYLVVLSMLLNHCAKQPGASQQLQVHIQVEVQQVLEQMNADQKTSQPNSQQQQSKPKVP